MKILSILTFVISFLFGLVEATNTVNQNEILNDSCKFNGKKLYGKIKLVERVSDADIKVQIVNAFPDLKVKFVENFADTCGEWQIVENNEDLKVYITESFPDLKIQPVVAFPGLPQ